MLADILNFECMVLANAQCQEIFSSGILLRGAICVGDLFIGDHATFGPALIDAYDLESNVAVFPRIAIRPAARPMQVNDRLPAKPMQGSAQLPVNPVPPTEVRVAGAETLLEEGQADTTEAALALLAVAVLQVWAPAEAVVVAEGGVDKRSGIRGADQGCRWGCKL
jgi:hypothetical protein